MNGVLVVDKPSGPTSHDVVAVVRRAVGLDRIGHTGTLDPLATGVLPLVLGRATRLASFLSSAEKEYVAKLRFGATTATYDAEALVVTRDEGGQPTLAPPPVRSTALAEATIAEALPEFLGTYWQMPPPFSAKKIAGTPAYKLARRREPVAVKPAEVRVREIELCSYADGLAELRIVCSSGFYVRSLAHDFGERLACGAYLEALRRTRAGDFTLEGAVPLEAIEAEGRGAFARLIPMDRLLTQLPSVILNEEGVRRATHGNALSREDFLCAPAGPRWGGNRNDQNDQTDQAQADGVGARLRLVDSAGALLGIAERLDSGLLHPVIVLV